MHLQIDYTLLWKGRAVLWPAATMVSIVFLEGDSASRRYSILAGGKYAGGITVYGYGETVSYGIAIPPKMRRQGIARGALLQLFVILAQDWVKEAQVFIRPDNTASLALHKSLGFHPVPAGGDNLCLRRAL